MNIKKGDVLKRKIDPMFEHTVLEIIGDLVFVSSFKFDKYGCEFFTLEGLKETFELPEEKWVPKEESTYFYVNITGTPEVYNTTWINHPIDVQRYELGNCFPTKEVAEAKLAEVLKVLQA